MAGIEVIGAIASASQLIQYSTKLIRTLNDLYCNIDKSGNRYQQYKDQIEQLYHVASSLQNTKRPLPRIVITHIETLFCTARTIDKALKKTLGFGPSNKWKKCVVAVKVLAMEETITRGFHDLERDKTCLILCIVGVQVQLLDEINTKLDGGNTRVESMERMLQDRNPIAARAEWRDSVMDITANQQSPPSGHQAEAAEVSLSQALPAFRKIEPVFRSFS